MGEHGHGHGHGHDLEQPLMESGHAHGHAHGEECHGHGHGDEPEEESIDDELRLQRAVMWATLLGNGRGCTQETVMGGVEVQATRFACCAVHRVYLTDVRAGSSC